MRGYRRSPTLSAVLRDLEDMQRHGRCQRFTLRYVEGRLYCSECGVEQASERLFGYTRDAGVEPDNLESRGGPSSVLNPLEAGRSASSRLSR